MRYAIDKFVQIGGTISVTGWCEPTDLAPTVLLKGQELPTRVSAVARSDVEAAFGEGASAWGFKATAASNSDFLDPADVSVRLGGLTLPMSAPTMAQAIDEMRIRFLSEVTSESTVLEIGSRARSGNTHRSLFPAGCRYIGLDIASGPNVDVVGDAHDLRSLISAPVDFVFSISTFEHLLMPWVAALEMTHVMKKGALAFIQSHQSWPVHEEPWDFFRFSDNAWHGLFNAHTGFEVVSVGYQFPASIASHTDIGPAVHGLAQEPAWLLSACLVRKIGEPQVSWSAKVADIYNLGYDHGAR